MTAPGNSGVTTITTRNSAPAFLNGTKNTFDSEAANEQKDAMTVIHFRFIRRSSISCRKFFLIIRRTVSPIFPLTIKTTEIEFTSDMEILNAALETTVSSEDTSDERHCKKLILLEEADTTEKLERTAHIIESPEIRTENSKEQNMLLSISESLFQTISKRYVPSRSCFNSHHRFSDEEAQITVKKRIKLYIIQEATARPFIGPYKKSPHRILMGEIP